MFRLSEYIKKTLKNENIKENNGKILIWNITDNCNLKCHHCYLSSKPIKNPKEINIKNINETIKKLKKIGVYFVILSGGEPLTHKNIFKITSIFKNNSIKTCLSSNGLLINKKNIKIIKENFDYLGISIDGNQNTHDFFRTQTYSFKKSINAIRLSLESNINTGIRFTLTKSTYKSIENIFTLAEKENIPKIYISHLVYSGRASELSIINKEKYNRIVCNIINKSFFYIKNNFNIEITTGNNDTDSIILLKKFKNKFPTLSKKIYENLKIWKGNKSGTKLINIDNNGNLKIDPFFKINIGNIFINDIEEIIKNNEIINNLKIYPRILEGKCRKCQYLKICNGNSRARALTTKNNYLDGDPGCYLF